MHRAQKTIFLIGFLMMFLPPAVMIAKVGVGVGTGSIEVHEVLQSGKTYTLPSLVVLNTGDEPSRYGVRIAHRENQPELKPDESWFRFEPSSFDLDPGESQLVNVYASLPIRDVVPGDYFAFLQARPIVTTPTDGSTSVGVAAASQLRFTVEPSNIFQALYYKFSDWYARYHPWNTVILAIIFLAVLFRFMSRWFTFRVSRK